MDRPAALDLFCGAGGVAAGLIAAGYDVVGIDLHHQPDYPGRFIRADALNPPVNLRDFDFVWASPPCQAYSTIQHLGAAIKTPRTDRLVPQTRELLADHPRTCIENVPGAPVRKDLTLRGQDFGLPQLRRKRVFELSFPCPPPILLSLWSYPQPLLCSPYGHGEIQSVARRRKALGLPYNSTNDERAEAFRPGPALVGLTDGAGNKGLRDRRRAAGLPPATRPEEMASLLGIDHIKAGTSAERRRRIAQCIPPVYAYYIGQQAMEI